MLQAFALMNKILILWVSCDYPLDQNNAGDKAKRLNEELNKTEFDEGVRLLDISEERIGNKNRFKVRFRPTGKKPLNETAIFGKVEGVMKEYVDGVHCIIGRNMEED
jgi:hypothetical protein